MTLSNWLSIVYHSQCNLPQFLLDCCPVSLLLRWRLVKEYGGTERLRSTFSVFGWNRDERSHKREYSLQIQKQPAPQNQPNPATLVCVRGFCLLPATPFSHPEHRLALPPTRARDRATALLHPSSSWAPKWRRIELTYLLHVRIRQPEYDWSVLPV
jgi:hypothetical protein